MGKTRDGVVVPAVCKLYDLHLDYIEDRISRFISIVDETVKKNGCDKMVFHSVTATFGIDEHLLNISNI